MAIDTELGLPGREAQEAVAGIALDGRHGALPIMDVIRVPLMGVMAGGTADTAIGRVAFTINTKQRQLGIETHGLHVTAQGVAVAAGLFVFGHARVLVTADAKLRDPVLAGGGDTGPEFYPAGVVGQVAVTAGVTVAGLGALDIGFVGRANGQVVFGKFDLSLVEVAVAAQAGLAVVGDAQEFTPRCLRIVGFVLMGIMTGGAAELAPIGLSFTQIIE